jgi:SAM-dependent methyltransferase
MAHTGLKRRLVQQRNAAVLFGGNWFWKRVAEWRPPWRLDPLDPLFAHTTLKSLRAPILDVGCGNGRFLRQLIPAGFDNLLGIDPFLREDVELGPLRLEAKTLDQLNRTGFELILFDHSLEHIPDQIGTLRMVRKLLSPTGVCVVRIPIAESDVWFKYGPDWFELDAPRHFCIHTPTSVRMAAARAGLEVFHLEYEVISCAYWGSELYQRDIPYISNGRAIDLDTVFSHDELAAFEWAAQESNKAGSGGRGAFYLRRAANGAS